MYSIPQPTQQAVTVVAVSAEPNSLAAAPVGLVTVTTTHPPVLNTAAPVMNLLPFA